MQEISAVMSRCYGVLTGLRERGGTRAESNPTLPVRIKHSVLDVCARVRERGSVRVARARVCVWSFAAEMSRLTFTVERRLNVSA